MSVTSWVNVSVPLASPTRTQTAFSDMMLKLAVTGDESDGRREEKDPCNEMVEIIERSEVTECRTEKKIKGAEKYHRN